MQTATKFDYKISSLDDEFSKVAAKFGTIQNTKDQFVDYYNTSAFYPRKNSSPAKQRNLRVNMLQFFADKNSNYVGRMPKFKVPARQGGGMEPDRDQAGILERVLYAAHRANSTDLLFDDWADDGTIMGDFFAYVYFDVKSRIPKIQRFDPRNCYYVYEDLTSGKFQTFWYAEPMTKEAIERQYGVTPENSSIAIDDKYLADTMGVVDGVERFWVVWRWDQEQYCCWVGDDFLVPPHPHYLGEVPVERCVPFSSKKRDQAEPRYFLESILELQAEFNQTLQTKSSYVERSGRPILWGRGIFGADWEQVKEQTASGEGGGAVGLTPGGELGLLQPSDMQLFNEHMKFLFDFAKHATGFSDATFGEMMGANTSGDALDLYMQPTAQATLRQWVKVAAFFRRINTRILRYCERFGLSVEQMEIDGYRFAPAAIDGYYTNQVIAPSGAPKNEIEVKRLALEAARDGTLPLYQALEDCGYDDPQAIIEMLKTQNVDPKLNPDVQKHSADLLKTLADAHSKMNPTPPPPAAAGYQGG